MGIELQFGAKFEFTEGNSNFEPNWSSLKTSKITSVISSNILKNRVTSFMINSISALLLHYFLKTLWNFR